MLPVLPLGQLPSLTLSTDSHGGGAFLSYPAGETPSTKLSQRTQQCPRLRWPCRGAALHRAV